MISIQRTLGAIVLAVSISGLLAGCGETSDLELLSEDSVTGVEETYEGDQIPAVGWCRDVNIVQSRASAGSQPPAAGVEFRLDNGDYVHAVVMGPGSGKSVEALADLPDDRWGYSSTEAGAAGREVFMVTPDGNLLAVGVRHEGEGEPGVDVQELIEEGAKNADTFVHSDPS